MKNYGHYNQLADKITKVLWENYAIVHSHPFGHQAAQHKQTGQMIGMEEAPTYTQQKETAVPQTDALCRCCTDSCRWRQWHCSEEEAECGVSRHAGLAPQVGDNFTGYISNVQRQVLVMWCRQNLKVRVLQKVNKTVAAGVAATDRPIHKITHSQQHQPQPCSIVSCRALGQVLHPTWTPCNVL